MTKYDSVIDELKTLKTHYPELEETFNNAIALLKKSKKTKKKYKALKERWATYIEMDE